MNGTKKSQVDWFSRAWWTVGVVLTASFFLKGVGVDLPFANKATASIRRGSDSAIRHEAPQNEVHSSFRNIEAIRVGDRVVARNPDLAEHEHNRPSRVNPATWKKLRLYWETIRDDGSVDDLQVETLQPPEWLDQHSARVGGLVPLPLDLQEMELPTDLMARVLSIEPCPSIKDGPGQVVLTTVNRNSDYIFDLTVGDQGGQTEVIGVTGHHRFYSQSRQGWIPADQLQENEWLATHVRHAQVISASRRQDLGRVFNLTVEQEHVYHVARCRVLVHNNYDEIVTIYKAPQTGKAKKQLEEGYIPEDFAEGDKSAYFAKDRQIAEEYATHYNDGIIEIDIPKQTYDQRIFMHERQYQGSNYTEIPIPAVDFDVLNQSPRRHVDF